jgi:hypothetical protein
MKFSAVKRQLLDDQVESAKALLTYTAEIERKGELDFNPYLKSEMQHLQKYVDQLSVKPKSPFSVYRRTESEDISYCLHRKHSKSMSTLSGLMKSINKELYRLKKLKQAEKKLDFLELFQTQPGQEENQYKLPESQTNIPQLSSPKPRYDPITFHDEEDEKPPEMSRAMEGFLKQQEKERKEKEAKKEIKPIAIFVPELKSSDKKVEKEKEEKFNTKPFKILKEHPLTTSVDSKYEAKEKEKETKETSELSQRKPLSFSNLRQSGPTSLSPRANLFSSSDPERPYGAYVDKGPYPHFASSLGRSSGGTTLEGHQTKSDEKSRGGAYY